MKDCAIPTSFDAIRELYAPLIVANLVLKLILKFSVSPTRSGNIPTTIIGVLLLLLHFRNNLELFLLLMAATAMGIIIFVSNRSLNHLNRYIWIYCGALIILNEVASYRYHLNFMRLRQHLMLLLMKLVSICPVGSDKKHDDPPVESDDGIRRKKIYLETTAYVFHPGSVLLGSWHPVFPKTHQNYTIRNLKIVSSLAFSFVFQLLSNCLIQWVVVEYIERLIAFNLYYVLPETLAVAIHKVLIAYFVALQFRTSHYFICFLTQSSFLFWNHVTPVCKPSHVELPRSMETVATAWNNPVHIWLKQYVFKPCKSSYGGLASVLITYAISSFMHGLNFQIWSVLLTLGVITYLERMMRDKLATIFDSCVRSKGCTPTHDSNQTQQFKCQHSNRNSPLVLSVNASFSIIAVLHLAYLGSTFDGREESSLMTNVISVWYELGFYSHIITLITFVVYILI